MKRNGIPFGDLFKNIDEVDTLVYRPGWSPGDALTRMYTVVGSEIVCGRCPPNSSLSSELRQKSGCLKKHETALVGHIFEFLYIDLFVIFLMRGIFLQNHINAANEALVAGKQLLVIVTSQGRNTVELSLAAIRCDSLVTLDDVAFFLQPIHGAVGENQLQNSVAFLL